MAYVANNYVSSWFILRNIGKIHVNAMLGNVNFLLGKQRIFKQYKRRRKKCTGHSDTAWHFPEPSLLLKITFRVNADDPQAYKIHLLWCGVHNPFLSFMTVLVALSWECSSFTLGFCHQDETTSQLNGSQKEWWLF